MAMAVDTRQQQTPFSSMGGYESIRYQQPQFSNPWTSSTASSHGQLYATSLPAPSINHDVKHYSTHAPNASSAYASNALPAPSLATGMLPMDPDLLQQTDLHMAQDMSVSRPYGSSYATSAAPNASTYAPASAPQYSTSYGYQQVDRRPSHPSVATAMLMGAPIEVQRPRQSSYVDFNDRLSHVSDADRQGFSDAVEASRGMVAMSQSDITPRNVYETSQSSRSSMDSYGFPTSSHSSRGSVSSQSSYPYSYASSVSDNASVADYSSANEDGPNSRTLPRPVGLINGSLPPAPQSMMGQFSSKVASSSQKKHKCKICDKRFTRPSSLQTHMYSHTGEKPFACDVDGCGRHFSVVSNLRRHRKVHRGDGHDHPSPDDDDE
ncbi:hypothetical protein LTR56_002579 [Elasticomyces elasticus]|nr:hypothetical protein LTR22_013481 [Elasticomyces elasticus]KAK3657065.1 hypothetical protein LTR56_002579 [Elasticomyces elasticus]KAK4926706.1 hypothetical protein LTR49_006388 [Elasticomyces elasticus]KAK5762343.1 hypothetical protein LTS12_007502 [Elasticomyces elasticus]